MGRKGPIEYLRNSGIRVVIEFYLPNTYLDGSAFLLSDGPPVIGMTLRQDRLDNFWFVLFHEFVHIIKHLHKGNIESIFDDLDAKADDIEQVADEQAGEILVPEDKWNTALARFVRSGDSIRDFANEIGIHPVCFIFDELRGMKCQAIPVTGILRDREYQREITVLNNITSLARRFLPLVTIAAQLSHGEMITSKIMTIELEHGNGLARPSQFEG